MQTLSHESQKEPLDPDYQGTSHSITRSTYLLPDGTGAIDCLRKVENTRVDQKTVEDLTWYNPLETESEYTVKQAMSAEGSIEYQPSSVLQDFAADQSIDMSTFVAMIKSKGAQVGRDNLSRQFSEYAWSQYASQLSADGSERSGVINEFLIYSHLFALNQGFAKHYLPEVLELYFTSIPGAGKEGSYTPSLSLKELKNAHRLNDYQVALITEEGPETAETQAKNLRNLIAILRDLGGIAKGLKQAKVVHRNICPENLLVVEDESAVPRLKLIDFGDAIIEGHPEVAAGQVAKSRYTIDKLDESQEAWPNGKKQGAEDDYAIGQILLALFGGFSRDFDQGKAGNWVYDNFAGFAEDCEREYGIGLEAAAEIYQQIIRLINLSPELEVFGVTSAMESEKICADIAEMLRKHQDQFANQQTGLQEHDQDPVLYLFTRIGYVYPKNSLYFGDLEMFRDNKEVPLGDYWDSILIRTDRQLNLVDRIRNRYNLQYLMEQLLAITTELIIKQRDNSLADIENVYIRLDSEGRPEAFLKDPDLTTIEKKSKPIASENKNAYKMGKLLYRLFTRFRGGFAEEEGWVMKNFELLADDCELVYGFPPSVSAEIYEVIIRLINTNVSLTDSMVEQNSDIEAELGELKKIILLAAGRSVDAASIAASSTSGFTAGGDVSAKPNENKHTTT